MQFSFDEDVALHLDCSTISANPSRLYSKYVVVGGHGTWSILLTNFANMLSSSANLNLTVEANNAKNLQPGGHGFYNPITYAIGNANHDNPSYAQVVDPDFTTKWVQIKGPLDFVYSVSGASVHGSMESYRFIRLSCSAVGSLTASLATTAFAYYWDSSNVYYGLP